MECIILNNGVRMPKLGFGTINQFDDQIIDNVAFALNNGYQLIDTANRYGNEVEVGKGLKKSGKAREDYFLETKLGPTLYENDQAIDDTLKRLDVDYLDLMILHHPVNNYIYAYKMLEKAYKEDSGKIAIFGIETIVLAVITLGLIYVNLMLSSNYINIVLIIAMIIAIYYVLKSIIMHIRGKKKYFIDNMKEIINTDDE